MKFEKKCEEIGVKLERENKGWTKQVTGVDPSQRGGYSILGEFIKSDANIDLEDGIYLDCDKKDDYHQNIFRLFELKNGELTLLSEITGTKWTTEFHKIIKEKLGKTIDEAVSEIKKIIRQFDCEQQLELKRKLWKTSKISSMFKEIEVEDTIAELEEEHGECNSKNADDYVCVAIWKKIDKKFMPNEKPSFEFFELDKHDGDELGNFKYHIFSKWGEYLAGIEIDDDGVTLNVAKLRRR